MTEIWVHQNLLGIASRGINFWQSPDDKDRRLILQINHFIEEIDARSGKSILTFGNNGLVDLRVGLSRDVDTVTRIKSDTPVRVFENLIILGSSTGEGYMSPPGALRAYNVLIGKMAWNFHTIPHPGAATGSARISSPTASSLSMCAPANFSGTSSSSTTTCGTTTPPQPPNSSRSGTTARLVDAVAQAGKLGFLYVFDRATGQPIWPIAEPPVPKSAISGEQSWPTQPFPTAPPAFARRKMTVDDINPYLKPEEIAGWKKKILSDNNQGIFTPPPPSKETVALPGARGGSNWGSSASNPSKGIVYLLTQDWPSFVPLVAEHKLPSSNGRYGASDTGKTIYMGNCQGCHGPNRLGAGGAPSLVGIDSRYNLDEFKQIVSTGKGDMPAFPSLIGAKPGCPLRFPAQSGG